MFVFARAAHEFERGEDALGTNILIHVVWLAVLNILVETNLLRPHTQLLIFLHLLLGRWKGVLVDRYFVGR